MTKGGRCTLYSLSSEAFLSSSPNVRNKPSQEHESTLTNGHHPIIPSCEDLAHV